MVEGDSISTRKSPSRRNRRSARVLFAAKPRGAFLLVLVMLVIAMASLAMLNFSRAMLISNETSKISSGRLQARLCAESGAQAVRMFLALSPEQRMASGGTWANPNFQARNVIPSTWPQRRGNFTIISPAFDEQGSYGGIRYGLQNESAKLNLNALIQLDQLASTGALAPAESEEESSGDGALGGFSLAPLAGADGTSAAANMLLALPGMTPEIADAILDWLDSDETPRVMGAESEYYTRLQPAYKPTNGPIDSIEQLLLVRGVTPHLLFGYDENRNGMLDPGEMEKLSLGLPPGMMPGQINTASLDPNYTPPPPLGLASYLTIHSREKNVASDGTPRINLNSEDLQTLYDDLKSALGNEEWASFIVAFRIGGSLANPSSNPLNMYANLTAGLEGSGTPNNGLIGAARNQSGATVRERMGAPSGPAGNQTGGNRGSRGEGGGAGEGAGQVATQSQPWTPDLLDQIDLSSPGQIRFQQVLDLFDATVTLGEGDQARTYSSPFTSDPTDLATTTPILMDRLTTVDAPAIPGRLNIMECPRELLQSIPGVTPDLANLILAARMDGSQSEIRRFETWLVAEGLVSMDQLRGMLPLITCGGDVYKAQVIGYLEGEAAYSRIEVLVDAAGDRPEIRFFRRLDHLGRGFSIPTLGERPDAAFASGATPF